MSIKSELLHGVFWTAVQKYSGFFIGLLISAVLARLITPDEFGVVALASVFIAFFSMFTDMGIGAAIIHNQNLDDDDINALFSMTLIGGFVLASLFFFASFVISSVYGNPALVPVCQLLSFNLLFSTWNLVPNALIRKKKCFKFIAERELLFQVVGGLIAIIGAFCGIGVYALLIPPIMASLGVWVLNLKKCDLHISYTLKKSALDKVMSFSVYQFLFDFINYFSRNLDKLIMGRCFGLAELGYYDKSYRLMNMPLGYVTGVISPVMLPILASLQNDLSDLANKYNKIVKLLSVFSFPIGVFAFFAANDIIMVVFGNQWINSVPVFRILAWSIPLQLILSSIGSIYQSSGNTKCMFYSSISNTCVTVTGFLVAAFYYKSIEAMAWAWTITLTINFVVSYFVLYRIVLKSSLLRFYLQLLWALCSAAVLFALLYAVSLCNTDFSAFISLLIKGVVFVVVLLASVQLTGILKK